MTKSKDILALIPARGGSKSIPKKNIYNLLGKPLIAWTILQAKASENITRVIVSTDDEEIARVSQEYGAEVPFMRPSKYAEDTSTDFDVFNHAINWLSRNENYMPDLIVHLRPTGPARYVDLIDKAINELSQNNSHDSLRSVSLSSQTPFKMWFLEENSLSSVGEMLGIKGSHSMPRQSLRKAYWQNGYVDIVKPTTILNMESMSGNKILPFVINHSVHDIDYENDIPIVEKNLKKVIENNFQEPKLEIEERHPS